MTGDGDAELVVSVPVPLGDALLEQGARLNWRGARVTRDWQEQIGRVISARHVPGGRGVEVRIALNPEHRDIGAVPRQGPPPDVESCWVYVHAPPLDAPYAAMVSPRRRGLPCAEPGCSTPADHLTRTNIALPVYDPRAYEARCSRHRVTVGPIRPPAADGDASPPSSGRL